MTPLERLENQQKIAQIMGDQPAMSYFNAGQGAGLLLVISQGIQAVQMFCLATDGVMLTPP